MQSPLPDTHCVNAVAVADLPASTSVIISSSGDKTMQCGGWPEHHAFPLLQLPAPVGRDNGPLSRLAAPWSGNPLRDHDGTVETVAAEALPGGAPIIRGGRDGTVRAWWLADGIPGR